ncbi:MAG: hypothetical protein IPK72_07695 [Candidatus Eisenbacteria bacterium]|nr:hypothetical protein [Candidatus Eisenbacteria bacterium]
MSRPDGLYILARRVLLDAVEALGDHLASVVLVGAQAIYLRVGESDLAIAPFTTDGDLVLDPAKLAEIPPLETALTRAGFFPASRDSVGVWISRQLRPGERVLEIPVDLLVPASVSPGKGRRAARLPGHGARVARNVRGLEGALFDSDRMELRSLEPGDPRRVELAVAGPAALLIAKLHKLADREGTDRERDKDALDIYRILRGCEFDDLVARYKRLGGIADSKEAADTGRQLLERLFGTTRAVGCALAARSLGPLSDPEEVRQSAAILTQTLLDELRD